MSGRWSRRQDNSVTDRIPRLPVTWSYIRVGRRSFPLAGPWRIVAVRGRAGRCRCTETRDTVVRVAAPRAQDHVIVRRARARDHVIVRRTRIDGHVVARRARVDADVVLRPRCVVIGRTVAVAPLLVTLAHPRRLVLRCHDGSRQRCLVGRYAAPVVGDRRPVHILRDRGTAQAQRRGQCGNLHPVCWCHALSFPMRISEQARAHGCDAGGIAVRLVLLVRAHSGVRPAQWLPARSHSVVGECSGFAPTEEGPI